MKKNLHPDMASIQMVKIQIPFNGCCGVLVAFTVTEFKIYIVHSCFAWSQNKQVIVSYCKLITKVILLKTITCWLFLKLCLYDNVLLVEVALTWVLTCVEAAIFQRYTADANIAAVTQLSAATKWLFPWVCLAFEDPFEASHHLCLLPDLANNPLQKWFLSIS